MQNRNIAKKSSCIIINKRHLSHIKAACQAPIRSTDIFNNNSPPRIFIKLD